jgi:hypothetical protein
VQVGAATSALLALPAKSIATPDRKAEASMLVGLPHSLQHRHASAKLAPFSVTCRPKAVPYYRGVANNETYVFQEAVGSL